MEDRLLSELAEFTAELESKEAAAVYVVPDQVISAVRKARSLERLLHEIFMQVSGSGGIELQSVLRREFGIKSELTDRLKQWAPYSKDHFEDELHEAIDRADIRAGNQGIFFAGTPSKQEAAEALALLQGIAHAAVQIQFRPDPADPQLFVEILDKILQFYALPNTYPEGSAIQYRNLISEERLRAVSDGHEAVLIALKQHARQWYQHAGWTFLESREGYFSYEDVRNFLYVLSEEQLNKLRNDYICHIHEEFQQLKRKPDLHRAKGLLHMLETVLSWTPPIMIN
ncbi:hypothetical protein DNH61_03365 [Paenibacillus sambharensis]|uniref:Uncharacterized protein n=1 Tax=Paenibacillus sambharensis TaxID=1803190 RepID=A0A2W1LFC0_9BACL|nr:hypothetical protein [Paenibacillus sambharensis]PZD97399.1 hypothetical protein DNH61_03365 [Paenibacillus sambharensis]